MLPKGWVPRHPLLCKWAGVYDIPASPMTVKDLMVSLSVFTSIGDVVRALYSNLPLNDVVTKLETPKGMKLRRVLLEMGFEEADITKVEQRIKHRTLPTKVVLSVRPKDILGRGSSRHFSTCLNQRIGTNRKYLNDDILNPDIAVAYIRDRSGQMESRVTVRLGYEDLFKSSRPIGLWFHSQVYGVPFNFKTALSSFVPIQGQPIRRGYMDGD